MIATYVDPVKTPLTFEAAADAMRSALYAILSRPPDLEALALALAKTALETGRWQSMWCDNWGNLKASETYQGMFTCITLNEVLNRNGKTKTIWFAPEGELAAKPGSAVVGQRWDVPPGHPQTRMRAMANQYDGAYDYVDFVSSGRWKEAWRMLLRGDAAAYVAALKAKGYFTAEEAPYRIAVQSIQREFVKRLAGVSFEPAPVDESAAMACISVTDQPWWDRLVRSHRDPDDGDDEPPAVA